MIISITTYYILNIFFFLRICFAKYLISQTNENVENWEISDFITEKIEINIIQLTSYNKSQRHKHVIFVIAPVITIKKF